MKKTWVFRDFLEKNITAILKVIQSFDFAHRGCPELAGADTAFLYLRELVYEFADFCDFQENEACL